MSPASSETNQRPHHRATTSSAPFHTFENMVQSERELGSTKSSSGALKAEFNFFLLSSTHACEQSLHKRSLKNWAGGSSWVPKSCPMVHVFKLWLRFPCVWPTYCLCTTEMASTISQDCGCIFSIRWSAWCITWMPTWWLSGLTGLYGTNEEHDKLGLRTQTNNIIRVLSRLLISHISLSLEDFLKHLL